MANLTDKIFELSAPYDNPYQGTEKRVLFVCSAGLLRSATAANIYAGMGYNTRAAGSSSYALIPLSANLIAWAQLIVFVNKENHKEAMDVFKNEDNAVDKLVNSIVLDIPDVYEYKHPKLIAAFKTQLKDVLPETKKVKQQNQKQLELFEDV